MSTQRRAHVPWRIILGSAAVLLALDLLGAGIARAQQGCDRCHDELELLRQQSGTLARAQQLVVPERVVAASAHGEMSCADCHTGFARFPHVDARASTASCASCHAAADTLWRQGAHAGIDDEVTCSACHGIHDTRSADTLRAPHGAAHANAPCIACHEVNRLGTHEPHADSVSCASCHAPHDVRPADDPRSLLAASRQPATCGACHDSTAAVWSRDIHGDERLRSAHPAGRAAAADEVTCTSCHTGHQMAAADDSSFAALSVERCAACHEQARRTFFGSYHGKATALGSRVSASCADCHGAHTIFPDSMPASHIAAGNLVETCRTCHEYANAGFVKYDSHPDPFNRARNPWIFYSFWLMNGLLVSVLAVFGAHTLLWWVRLWLDERRGAGHAHGTGDTP